jgi:DNA polymerase-3 subunit epsilon
MRQIILDTETTGLKIEEGHRGIEIGSVELISRRPRRHWHCFLNPEREIDEDALAVPGLDLPFLSSKPRFHDVADDMIAFLEGAELVIHNAAFDVNFLNAELDRLGKSRIETICSVFDTLKLAREMHPGQRNSLDALCKRYGIDNSRRDKYGALLDAQLLAEVYLAMTRGQETLLGEEIQLQFEPVPAAARPEKLLVLHASAEEEEAHRLLLERISAKGKPCLWLDR